MQRVLSILFGAGFTVAVAWACGALLLRRLRLELDPLEEALFSFLSGAACASLAVFLLCLVQQARAGVFLAAGTAVIASAVWRKPGRRKPLPAMSRSWLLFLFLVLTPYFFAYFVNAIAPEVSPDGSGYHLGNVARYLAHHGFVWDYHSMYSCFPQGMEMLFLVAFAFGAHSSAALVHFSFFLALPLLILCYGRRFDLVPASVFAAAIVFLSPVFGLTGTSAYNDVALATLSFAVFYLLQVWDEVNDHKLLLLASLLVGMCFAIKYTGALAAVFAVAWLLLSRRLIPWAKALLPAALLITPWLLRNWFWVGNPLAPFFNQWFPNSFFTYSMETAYLADVGHFEGLRHWWQFPLDMTLYGARIPGFLGPVFLLAPLALLALRQAQGRRLLAAAAVFSLPVGFNAATRFLMPGMPFLALGLGVAIQNSPGILPLLALCQALLCWPSVMPLYTADWSWRLRAIPIRAALRLQPEDEFLRQYLPDYALKVTVEKSVPKPQKIFSFSTRPEAYFDRTILVGYESAEGVSMQELLWGALQHPETRRRAMAELERKDVHFLLINPSDLVARDFKENANLWGITLLSETNGTRLYRID